MNYNKITSLTNPIIKDYLKLKSDNKFAKREHKFIIETSKLIEEAIKNGFEILTLLITDESLVLFEPFIKKHQLWRKTFVISKSLSKQLTHHDSDSQIYAIVKSKQLSQYVPKNGDNILFLDNLQDPGNLGTILRSGLALGINCVYMYNCVSLYSYKVLRASMGAAFKSSIQIISQPEIIDQLKQNGFVLIATCLDNQAIDMFQYKFKSQGNLVMIGNEGHGLNKAFLNKADIKLSLPMMNQIESLNVSTFTSIICYEIMKKKHNS